jgi:hypothetical protein
VENYLSTDTVTTKHYWTEAKRKIWVSFLGTEEAEETPFTIIVRANWGVPIRFTAIFQHNKSHT